MPEKMTKSDLYEWFDKRPIRGASTYRLMEIFLIQHWDEEQQRTSLSRKDIIKETGWKWSEVDKYIMFIDMNQLWLIKEDGELVFTPQV